MEKKFSWVQNKKFVIFAISEGFDKNRKRNEIIMNRVTVEKETVIVT